MVFSWSNPKINRNQNTKDRNLHKKSSITVGTQGEAARRAETKGAVQRRIKTHSAKDANLKSERNLKQTEQKPPKNR